MTLHLDRNIRKVKNANDNQHIRLMVDKHVGGVGVKDTAVTCAGTEVLVETLVALPRAIWELTCFFAQRQQPLF